MRYGLALSLVVFFAVVAGCTQRAAPLEAAQSSGAPRPTVVAIIDTGVNPYHRVFDATDVDAVSFGSVYGALPLSVSSSGSIEERIEKDTRGWGPVKQGVLYAFEGTRVLTISFGEHDDAPLLLDYTAAPGHGTGVAGIVATYSTSAIIVSIQVNNFVCDTIEECHVLPPLSQAMQWAAETPWIDVISVSQGFPGNPPFRAPAMAEADTYVAASRAAAAAGKLLIAGSGNTIAPPLGAQFAGPPWVIAVGGFESSQGGETVEAGKQVDVVANNTVWVAASDDRDRMDKRSGTSFATPIVAATLANALHLSKGMVECDGGPAIAIRSAMNATARPISSAEWDPVTVLNDGAALQPISAPIVAGGLQGGWGLVEPPLAASIARAAIDCRSGHDTQPDVAPFVEGWHSLREAYWERTFQDSDRATSKQ